MRLIFFYALFIPLTVDCSYDLTIVMPICYRDGIGRVGINLIEALNGTLSLNCISSRGQKSIDLTDLKESVKKVVLNEDQTAGKVAFMIDGVWYSLIISATLCGKS